MEANFALQICGCIFILLIVVIVWLIMRHSNLRSYYYKNYSGLDYSLGTFAFKNKYRYEPEPQFYSSIMEKMKKFFNIDHYFTAHELDGFEQNTGKFTCFLTRTSRSSFFKYSLNRVKLRLSAGYLQKNFTGLVLSYEYIAGFASNFVLFASKDSIYYDSDNNLNYKFLHNINRFNKVAEDIWAFNGYRLNSKPYRKLFENFARLYHDSLGGDCTMIVVYDNCQLNIFLCDGNLTDAKRLEDNLQQETEKVNEIVKFFKWMKQSSSVRHKPKYHGPTHNAFVEITRNNDQAPQKPKAKKSKDTEKLVEDKKTDKKAKAVKKSAPQKKKTSQKAIVKVEKKTKSIQKTKLETKVKEKQIPKAKPKTAVSKPKVQKKEASEDVKKITSSKTSKTTDVKKSTSKLAEKKSSSSAAETVKMKPVEKIVKEEVPKTTMEPVITTPAAETKAKAQPVKKRKRWGRVKPKHSHASIKKAQKQAMRQKKR